MKTGKEKKFSVVTDRRLAGVFCVNVTHIAHLRPGSDDENGQNENQDALFHGALF